MIIIILAIFSLLTFYTINQEKIIIGNFLLEGYMDT